MKVYSLSKSGISRFNSGELSFYQKDINEKIGGHIPGDWVPFSLRDKKIWGFINTASEGNPIYLTSKSFVENEAPAELVKKIVNQAYKKRLASGYECYRLFHGQADGLPGLTIDVHSNCVIVQIVTAGVDRFRSQIEDILKEIYKDRTIYFLDDDKKRAKELLPKFTNDELINEVLIKENGFSYKLDGRLLQKNGYYYDHRDNRTKSETLIKRMNIAKNDGLDLFCYMGSWGLHMLRAGVKKVDFVDQGNFKDAIKHAVKQNSLSGEVDYIRDDVFKFLDEVIAKGKEYDVICSDPPAFAKSEKNRRSAINGYGKLHSKIMKILRPGGILLASSCTHYISLEEFIENVQTAAQKKNRVAHLIDIGIQGMDHPMRSFADKANYIKYTAFKVE